MLHVRCPECGYLQTLSEERFLSISDNFLNCPHCNAKVPKEWTPQQEESVPEEARHKMLAFSKRILNGRDIRLEVVYALESLVRHYGPAEETNKALGVGYASVGEYRKAEEFLVQSLEDAPGDPELLQNLFRALFEQKKFRDAADVGATLLQTMGSSIDDEDVAGIALSLIEIGEKDEAQELFNSHPKLDAKNPLVKQVRRKLSNGPGAGIRRLFRTGSPVRWLKEMVHGEGGNRLLDKSQPVLKADYSKTDADSPPNPESRSAAEQPVNPKDSRDKALVEYWIYTPEKEVPEWGSIRDRLADKQLRQEDTERCLVFLDMFTQNNALAVEYIRKADAKEFFEYPEDIIPHNSRELTDADRGILREADTIVRLKLSLAKFSGTSHLGFMIRLTEAVRSLTNGVVQDAAAHILWGTEAWKRMAENPDASPIESHVQFETLDEGQRLLWIHTHGMQKFGLPDMEMEEVPSQLATAARAMMTLVAQSMLSTRNRGKDLQQPLVLPGTPLLLGFQTRPSDEEGHFPAGSLKLTPYSSNHDSLDTATTGKVLEEFLTYLPGNLSRASKTKKSEPAPKDNESDRVKQHLLDGHKRARQELSVFKKSFQQGAHDHRVHAVKIGFPAQGGQFEWMWVSLNAWQGEFLAGHVENVPVLRKDLEKGSLIKISEREIFDWVITREGQVLQGGYTERISG